MLLLFDWAKCARHLLPCHYDFIYTGSTKCSSNTNVHKVSSFVSYQFIEMNLYFMGSTLSNRGLDY